MIDLVIPHRPADIGAFQVRRVLPYMKRRSVGPFVFVDDFGPIEIVDGQSLDVLAHPHIGLATVTYLFSGKMTHRDSIGSHQRIEPGEVNWMTAGGGIVHSERASDAGNEEGERLLGLQTWVALPEELETCAPDFAHYAAESLPVAEGDGTRAKVILGEGFGVASPVRTAGEPFYAECLLEAGAKMTLPAGVEELSAYVLQGNVEIEGQELAHHTMAVFKPGARGEIASVGGAKFMLIGGTRLAKPRNMWWNFVATSREAIEDAKMRWHQGEFAEIPNETGRIPLPEGSFPKPQVL